MKWIVIAAAAGTGYLFWKGGASTSDITGSISRGWTATLGDLHLGPCTGCAGAANGAGGNAKQQPMIARDIYLGH